MVETGGGDERERYPYHRRFVRQKVRLRVLVDAKRSFQAWTHNLSEDGLCFEVPHKIGAGQQVEVWIYPLAREQIEPIRSRCRVIWLDAAPKGTRHGAQFVDFVGDGRERLVRLLAALTRPPTQPPPP